MTQKRPLVSLSPRTRATAERLRFGYEAHNVGVGHLSAARPDHLRGRRLQHPLALDAQSLSCWDRVQNKKVTKLWLTSIVFWCALWVVNWIVCGRRHLAPRIGARQTGGLNGEQKTRRSALRTQTQRSYSWLTAQGTTFSASNCADPRGRVGIEAGAPPVSAGPLVSQFPRARWVAASQ